MTAAAATVLARMRCNPSSLYVREIVQGCSSTVRTSEALDALCELQELGLVVPRTWALTELGKLTVAEGSA